MGPENLHSEFVKLFNTGDAEGLLALYEENAVFSPQPGQLVSGKTAIRQVIHDFLALKATMSLSTRYVMQSGDLALLSCSWSLRGSNPDGTPLEMTGSTAEVARRNAEGRWLYVIDNPFGA